MKYLDKALLHIAGVSPPARGRGLKLYSFAPTFTVQTVAPCAGAWIEISGSLRVNTQELRRPLRGGVD